MSIISNFPAGGTNVSDTTATAADVAREKVFYLSNGQRAQGTLFDFRGRALNIVLGNGNLEYNEETNRLLAYPQYDAIVGNLASAGGMSISGNYIAWKIGLISSPTDTISTKLKEGETLLGVTGAADSYTVSLTNGSSFPNLVYVAYDGTNYTTAGDTITVRRGDTITCYGNAGPNNVVYVNGSAMVIGSPVIYEYTVMSDVSISFEISITSHSYIYITTN